MFTFTESEFKQSRLYQSIKEECKQEIKLKAKLEILPRLLALGLTTEQIARGLDLTLAQVQQAIENQSSQS